MDKIDDLYMENLNEFVYDDRKIVSYKYLADIFGIPVNLSKQMLYNFYTGERSNGKVIYATFFLSGLAPINTFGRNNRSSNDEITRQEDDDLSSEILNEHFILLCGCNKLEEAKSKFTKLFCVHVYAVSALPIEDFQELKYASGKDHTLYR